MALSMDGSEIARQLYGRESEDDYAEKVLARLEPYFDIYREVWGTHCAGHRLRIDAIVRPKDQAQWRNPNTALGLEFKALDQLTGWKECCQWIGQCGDYAHVDWPEHGRVWVFACPGLMATKVKNWDRPNEIRRGPRVPTDASDEVLRYYHLLNQFQLGELAEDPKYGLSFYLNYNHRLWSEGQGVELGRTHNLEHKVGRR